MIGVNKDKNNLELRVYGVIGDGWFADVNADEMAHILDVMRNVDAINVRIHSPGGSIAAGTAIYNALKNHKATKRVYIEGECCSIATVIAMAGDEIVMSPSAQFMIHNPLVNYISGGAEDLRGKAETLDKLKEGIINAYLTKSNLKKEEISDMMDKTTYFTAAEALKYGFITEIENAEKNGVTRTYSFQSIPAGYFNIKNEEANMSAKEIKDVTLEDLRNENETLYNALIEQGATAERTRIQGFEIWENKVPGAKEIIQKYKYTDLKSANEVAAELLNFIGTEQQTETNKTAGINQGEFENKKRDGEALKELNGNVDAEAIKNQKEEQDIADIIEFANI